MTRYLIERQFSVGQEEMNVVGRRSRVIAEERYTGITWEHSHVAVGEDGRVRTFCVDQASREDELLGQHEVLQITEIVGDVTPDDFPA